MIWLWNLDTGTPHSQRGEDGCCMGRLALSWHPIFPHAGLGGFDKPCHHRQHRHLGREWWQWQWLPLVQQGMSSVWWSAHGGKIWMKKTADKALIKNLLIASVGRVDDVQRICPDDTWLMAIHYFSRVALGEEQPDQVGLELLQGDEVHEEALLQWQPDQIGE